MGGSGSPTTTAARRGLARGSGPPMNRRWPSCSEPVVLRSVRTCRLYSSVEVGKIVFSCLVRITDRQTSKEGGVSTPSRYAPTNVTPTTRNAATPEVISHALGGSNRHILAIQEYHRSKSICELRDCKNEPKSFRRSDHRYILSRMETTILLVDSVY